MASPLARFAPPDASGLLSGRSAIERGLAFLESLLGKVEQEPDLARVLRFAPVPEPVSTADVLRTAMERRQKVALAYTRKYDGATATYVANPYEVKPHDRTGVTMLYATEEKPTGHGPDKIHSFIYSRVHEAWLVRGTRFAPRWPTVPESV